MLSYSEQNQVFPADSRSNSLYLHREIRCVRRVAIRVGALAAHSRAARRCPTSTSTPTNALPSVGMADHDRMNSIFDRIDADGSGEIDPTELIMHLLGLGQEPDSVSELFKVLDTDGDGKISREEFIAGHDKLAAFQKRQPGAAAGASAAAASAPASHAAEFGCSL